ncbi:MAG: MFS transporter [Spirochaetales bacterium]
MRIQKKTLTFSQKVGFGVCDLGGNLFFTTMGFYLLYYFTDTVGIPPALAGTALLIGKLWDAITDPMVGVLSDRTQTRWGRRKPWMVAGAFLLLGGMLLLFHSPSFTRTVSLFLWAVGTYCFVNTAYTFVSIPYGALTPELTEDYHERSVLNGYRQFFALGGTFLGAGIVLPLVQLRDSAKEGWFLAGGVLGGIMLFSSLLTVVMVGKEKARNITSPRMGWLQQVGEVLIQKPFLRVLLPWTLHIGGITLIQSALVYYFEYIYQYKTGFQIALMILLTLALLCIPFWIWVSRKIGKKEVYNVGMLIFACTLIGFYFWGHRLPLQGAYLLMIPAGIGFSVQYAMPFAILPDVVEWDYAQTGIRREGVYYGVWTFASKTGQALASLLAGLVLSLTQYRPQEMVQSTSALGGIRFLASLLPATLCFLGVWIHRKYPLDRATYQAILEQIHNRERNR